MTAIQLFEIKQIAAIVISRIIILYIIVRQTASILIHSSQINPGYNSPPGRTWVPNRFIRFIPPFE